MTLHEVMLAGRNKLREAGVNSPEADIQWIVCAVTHFNRVQLAINKEQLLTPAQVEKIKEWVKRRCAREPLQYILGNQSFMNIKVMTDKRALIPRPETEILAERAINLIRKDYPRFERFELLDLCTGTGVLALAIAKKCTNVYATASDISPEALSLAKENIALCQLEERVSLAQGDLFEAVQGRRFHGIVSNPPYIASNVIDTLMPEVSQFEPRIALDGGQYGFDFYQRILTQAGDYLFPGGFLALEAEHFQFFPIRDLLEQLKLFTEPVFITDYEGMHRVCYVKKL